MGYGSQPGFGQPGFQGQPQQNYPNQPMPGANNPNQGVSLLYLLFNMKQCTIIAGILWSTELPQSASAWKSYEKLILLPVL